MKAMILAAGLGTRLKPMTDDLPKALIPVLNRPLLQHVVEHLKFHGFREIIINVHHHAQKILDFLKANENFGIRIEISHESKILETGGAIKKAAWFFDDGMPFLVHNVDILTDLNLIEMMKWHKKYDAIATLAVRKRDTKRQLLFENGQNLAGWQSDSRVERGNGFNPERLEPLSFMGVHIISSEIFALFPSDEYFSIIKAYLDIVNMNRKIMAYRGDKFFWYDIGKPESLKEAEHFLKKD